MIDAISNIGSAIAGTGVGAIGGFINLFMQMRHERALEREKLIYSRLDNIDKLQHSTYDKQTQKIGMRITRRTIAISIVITLVFIMIMAGFGYHVTIGFEETNGTISSLFFGHDDIKWITFNSFVIFPSFIYMINMILTFYFCQKIRG